MNEHDWLRCKKWRPMVEHLSGRISERKSLLYLCAGLRHIWHLLYSWTSREVVEVVERLADGLASEEEYSHAYSVAECPTFGYDFDPEFLREWRPNGDYGSNVKALLEMGVFCEADIAGNAPLGKTNVRDSLINAAHIAYHLIAYSDQGFHPHMVEHLKSQREWPGDWLVKEIFGNPFRPVTLEPEWQTETVRGIAQGIYYERAFDRLPILADALEEAGCSNADILLHFRGPGPHAHGCWALDVILGKA